MAKEFGKKAKREARRKERLNKVLDNALGAKQVTCSKCGRKVNILPIDSWAGCPCGNTVYR